MTASRLLSPLGFTEMVMNPTRARSVISPHPAGCPFAYQGALQISGICVDLKVDYFDNMPSLRYQKITNSYNDEGNENVIKTIPKCVNIPSIW